MQEEGELSSPARVVQVLQQSAAGASIIMSRCNLKSGVLQATGITEGDSGLQQLLLACCCHKQSQTSSMKSSPVTQANTRPGTARHTHLWLQSPGPQDSPWLVQASHTCRLHVLQNLSWDGGWRYISAPQVCQTLKSVNTTARQAPSKVQNAGHA